MAHRSNGFDLSRSGRVSFVVVTILIVSVVACSTGERLIPIGAGENDDRPAGPQFGGPEDAGEAGSRGSDAAVPNVPLCIATECPAPFATCTNGGLDTSYACGTNLLTDRNNCGECGNVCPNWGNFPDLNMETRCIDGRCRRQCFSQGSGKFQDCNGAVDDGCETDVTQSPDNCGVCGNKCPPGPDGVARCIDGQCGCPPGKTFCTDQCTDTSVDDANCGACGNQCQEPDAGPPPPNMEYRCSDGKCAQLRCVQGYADCNGHHIDDGCEIDVTHDQANCGACGRACPAGQKCLVRGNTIGCGCEPLETLCTDQNGRETCEDLLNDPKNCGSCGYPCPLKGNMTASCNKGFCEYACPPGFGNCDGDPRNGCETNLLINGRHCGTCGNQCDTAAGQPCISGSCLVTECDGGTETK